MDYKLICFFIVCRLSMSCHYADSFCCVYAMVSVEIKFIFRVVRYLIIYTQTISEKRHI